MPATQACQAAAHNGINLFEGEEETFDGRLATVADKIIQ
jgi:hypothetical protein